MYAFEYNRRQLSRSALADLAKPDAKLSPAA